MALFLTQVKTERLGRFRNEIVNSRSLLFWGSSPKHVFGHKRFRASAVLGKFRIEILWGSACDKRHKIAG